MALKLCCEMEFRQTEIGEIPKDWEVRVKIREVFDVLGYKLEV